jgi:predicted transport protein
VIDLEEGTQPSFGPIYNWLQDKLLALQKYINENLEKGFIQHSKSPNIVALLFVKKRMDFYTCVSITMD